MHAQLISVGDLFRDNHFKPARVQRQYIWDVDQCEVFHHDLLSAFISGDDSEYYLGPVILTKDLKGGLTLVYDGQQRLTTLTLYLAALSQKLEGPLGENIRALTITEDAERRPRMDLKTLGGALTRIVRRTSRSPDAARNMPVDWRIYNIDVRFRELLKAVENLEGFASWLLKRVSLNVLWADDRYGLTLFDRANNRGVHLKWFELAKSVVTSAVGGDFRPRPGTRFDEFWYMTEREAKHEFSDLIACAAFIRYSEIEPARALAAFEDEFDTDRSDEDLHAAGKDLFEALMSYRKTSAELQALRLKGADVNTEAELIRLQLLFLEYPHWKALLMDSEQRGLSSTRELNFLKHLRRFAYTAHLLG